MILTVFIISVKLKKGHKKQQVGGYIGFGRDARLGFFQRNKNKLKRMVGWAIATTPPMTTTPDIEGIDDNDEGMYKKSRADLM